MTSQPALMNKRRGAMSRTCSVLAMAAALAALTACHASKKSAASGSTNSGSEVTGNATAEEVAEEQRGDVACPAQIATAKPAGAPVDDVVGVRPGMTYEEAANVVMCDNALLVVTENKSRTYRMDLHGATIRQGFDAAFAEPRVQKTSKEIVHDMELDLDREQANARVDPLKPGQIRYYVGTMGMPGQERVISVAREEYYSEGKLPASAAVEQALVAKYGPPTTTNENTDNKNLVWKFDLSGRPVTETSPLYNSCSAQASPNAGADLSPDCGVTVSASIEAARDNPGLARGLAVSSQNGSEGYALLEHTEKALAAADQARQAREVNDAQQSASKPKL